MEIPPHLSKMTIKHSQVNIIRLLLNHIILILPYIYSTRCFLLYFINIFSIVHDFFPCNFSIHSQDYSTSYWLSRGIFCLEKFYIKLRFLKFLNKTVSKLWMIKITFDLFRVDSHNLSVEPKNKDANTFRQFPQFLYNWSSISF